MAVLFYEPYRSDIELNPSRWVEEPPGRRPEAPRARRCGSLVEGMEYDLCRRIDTSGPRPEADRIGWRGEVHHGGEMLGQQVGEFGTSG